MNKEEIRDAREQETHDTVMLLAPMVRDHHKTLYGNGRLGLKSRVTRMEAVAVIVPVAALVVAIFALWNK